MFYNETHLKVETPVTNDGQNLLFNEASGKKLTKITYLPVTARRALDNENKFLPTNLKHIITEMPGRTYYEPPAQKPDTKLADENQALKKQIAELQKAAEAKN